jgi:hypothetical protein
MEVEIWYVVPRTPPTFTVNWQLWIIDDKFWSDFTDTFSFQNGQKPAQMFQVQSVGGSSITGLNG